MHTKTIDFSRYSSIKVGQPTEVLVSIAKSCTYIISEKSISFSEKIN
jgi:hypothetical protein